MSDTLRCFRVLLAAAALTAHAAIASAQVATGKATGGPFFFLDAANFASKDTAKGRIEVFAKVAYSELLFTKFGDQFFRAQYEITYALTTKRDSVIARESQDREIITNRYEQTASDLRFQFSRITFNVPPGDYTLTATITDKETRKFGQRRQDILVRTFRDRTVGISDLIFADKIQKDTLSDIINIVPNVFKSFDYDFKQYLVYFEIYDSRYAWQNLDTLGQLPDDTDAVTVRYRILDKTQKVVLEDSVQRAVSHFQTFSSIEIDKKNIAYGRYILDVTVMDRGVRAASKAVFDVRLSTFTNPGTGTAFDLDEAIRQMRHVARSVNLSKVLKGALEEKIKFFNDFWKSKDPTPNTERNELMEEYYSRVDYANQYFSSGIRNGWESDRGMVYIIMSSPDDIERHPYESDTKPYEIWYYYQANLKLYFVDFQGVGDYELYNRQEFESYVFLHR